LKPDDMIVASAACPSRLVCLLSFCHVDSIKFFIQG
jgi:hypothetical protein